MWWWVACAVGVVDGASDAGQEVIDTGERAPPAPVCDDFDADGWTVGDPSCWTQGAPDCDDSDASVSPGAVETCNGIDDDCTGVADEPFDADGDEVGDCLDCDEADHNRHPDAVEVCDDLDNDCDELVDEGWDLDGDGLTTCRGDCDDQDASVHLWASDDCDGLDNDCDGLIDEGFDLDGDGYGPCSGDCDDTDSAVFPGQPDVCDGKDTDCDGSLQVTELDADGDGVPTCAGDCADDDAAQFPGQPELCNGVDDDCNPATNESIDNDGDGQAACSGDCNDLLASTFSGAAEQCNGSDDDCDGAIDEYGICGSCASVPWGATVHLYCPEARAWEDAHQQCLNMGLDLAAFTDGAEEIHVSDTALGLWATTWWAGLNDVANEGAWVWSNGEPVAYTNWSPGEPNDSGGEDCQQILWSGYAWNDLNCVSALPYVCEILP